jgi:hypothetical protein
MCIANPQTIIFAACEHVNPDQQLSRLRTWFETFSRIPGNTWGLFYDSGDIVMPISAQRTLFTLAALCLSVSSAHAVDTRLFPANTEIVVTINFQQAHDPPTSLEDGFKKVAGSLMRQAALNKLRETIGQLIAPRDQPFRKLADNLGFDPVTDLHTITLAHNGLSDGLVIVDGSFRADKFEAAFREFGKDVGEFERFFMVGKVPVCQIKVKDNANESVWVALIEGRSLVICDNEKAVRDALVRVEMNQFVAKKVQGLLKKTNDKQTFSFVATRDALMLPPIGNIGNLGPIPAKICGVCGTSTVTGDIGLEIHFDGEDDKTAKELVEAGNGGIFLLRNFAAAQARQDMRLAPFVDLAATLRMHQSGRFAVLTGSISYLNAGKLFEYIPR